MRIIALLFFCIPFFHSVFSQENTPAELFYDLNPSENRIILQSTLKNARSLNDLDSRYPASWVKEYKSVELIATCDDIQKKSYSKSDQLTQEQMELLKNADFGSTISVEVKYIPDNNLKHNDVQTINFSYEVGPEKEAEFIGGNEKMMQYLKEKVENKIPLQINKEDIKWTAIQFTVDRNGQLTDFETVGNTGFIVIDEAIKEAICEMPKWTPAENSKGEKVAQNFEFVLGNTSKICALNLYYTNRYFMN